MTQPTDYLIPVFSHAVKNKDTISECRLANALAHQNDSRTLLLSIKIDDKQYHLSLIGGMEIFDNEGNEYFYSQKKSIPNEVIREVELGESYQFEVTRGACFKWEDNNGRPLGESLDYIYLNTEKEIDRLLSFMQ